MGTIRMDIIRSLVLLNCACFILFDIAAQDTETGNQHTLTAGTAIRVINDALLSLSAEKFLTTELAYSFISTTIYRKKSITVSAGFMQATKGQPAVNEFSLQYTDAFSLIKNKDRRLNNYLGYTIALNPQLIKWGEQYSWTTINALSFSNSTVYTWKKNIVLLELTVPLAGLVSRPAGNSTYKNDINEMLYNSYSNLSFTSLHNLKAATVSLHYERAVSRRLQFQAGASFSYKKLAAGAGFQERAYRLNSGLLTG